MGKDEQEQRDRGGKEERMGAGGGSNGIIHRAFGELVCLHGALRAATATYSTHAI